MNSMKQLVAIYAVGAGRNKVLQGCDTKTPILLKVLVDETNKEDGIQNIPFSMLDKNIKSGLYVAVVNISSVCELKLFPFTESNQTTINDAIKPELLEKCSHSIDIFLGAASEEGEPTPAYVDQDPK